MAVSTPEQAPTSPTSESPTSSNKVENPSHEGKIFGKEGVIQGEDLTTVVSRINELLKPKKGNEKEPETIDPNDAFKAARQLAHLQRAKVRMTIPPSVFEKLQSQRENMLQKTPLEAARFLTYLKYLDFNRTLDLTSEEKNYIELGIKERTENSGLKNVKTNDLSQLLVNANYLGVVTKEQTREYAPILQEELTEANKPDNGDKVANKLARLKLLGFFDNNKDKEDNPVVKEIFNIHAKAKGMVDSKLAEFRKDKHWDKFASLFKIKTGLWDTAPVDSQAQNKMVDHVQTTKEAGAASHEWGNFITYIGNLTSLSSLFNKQREFEKLVEDDSEPQTTPPPLTAEELAAEESAKLTPAQPPGIAAAEMARRDTSPSEFLKQLADKHKAQEEVIPEKEFIPVDENPTATNVDPQKDSAPANLRPAENTDNNPRQVIHGELLDINGTPITQNTPIPNKDSTLSSQENLPRLEAQHQAEKARQEEKYFQQKVGLLEEKDRAQDVPVIDTSVIWPETINTEDNQTKTYYKKIARFIGNSIDKPQPELVSKAEDFVVKRLENDTKETLLDMLLTENDNPEAGDHPFLDIIKRLQGSNGEPQSINSIFKQIDTLDTAEQHVYLKNMKILGLALYENASQDKKKTNEDRATLKRLGETIGIKTNMAYCKLMMSAEQPTDNTKNALQTYRDSFARYATARFLPQTIKKQLTSFILELDKKLATTS